MRQALLVLNELKDKKLIDDYAIGGGIAALRWTEPFFTQDLDVFVVLEKDKSLIVLTPIYEYLKEKGYIWQKHWIMIEGIPVDLFPAGPLETEAVKQAVEVDYEGVKTKVMTPEYLIALFINAGRDKDFRKIELLLQQSQIDKDKLGMVLNRYGLREKFNKFTEK